MKAVIEHPLVRAVTLTGSTPAGKAVAAQAGAVIKKTVLELGGSDPYLVLEDADLDHAVSTCATSRLINSGQSCVNAKRFIIVEPLLAAFTERFVATDANEEDGRSACRRHRRRPAGAARSSRRSAQASRRVGREGREAPAGRRDCRPERARSIRRRCWAM